MLGLDVHIPLSSLSICIQTCEFDRVCHEGVKVLSKCFDRAWSSSSGYIFRQSQHSPTFPAGRQGHATGLVTLSPQKLRCNAMIFQLYSCSTHLAKQNRLEVRELHRYEALLFFFFFFKACMYRCLFARNFSNFQLSYTSHKQTDRFPGPRVSPMAPSFSSDASRGEQT